MKFSLLVVINAKKKIIDDPRGSKITLNVSTFGDLFVYKGLRLNDRSVISQLEFFLTKSCLSRLFVKLVEDSYWSK